MQNFKKIVYFFVPVRLYCFNPLFIDNFLFQSLYFPYFALKNICNFAQILRMGAMFVDNWLNFFIPSFQIMKHWSTRFRQCIKIILSLRLTFINLKKIHCNWCLDSSFLLTNIHSACNCIVKRNFNKVFFYCYPMWKLKKDQQDSHTKIGYVC